MEGSFCDISVASANRKSSAVTGSARKIKDNAADFHNLMLRWEKLNDQGFTLAENIVNLRQSRAQKETLLPADGNAPTTAGSPWQQPGGAEELQEECCKLVEIVDKMQTILTKMQRLAASQCGIVDLEDFQFGPEGRKNPLFHSWTVRQFDDACRLLLDAFSQELDLKRTVLQNLAHATTSELCLVYLSCWLHQPFVPPQARLTLEALLLETGHRPL